MNPPKMTPRETISLQVHVLFHAFLCHNETHEEAARARMACEWVSEMSTPIRRFLRGADCEVIGTALDFFHRQGVAPSMDVFFMESHEEYSPELNDFLQEYKALAAEGLPLMRTKAEMNHVFSKAVKAVQVEALARAAENARQIATAGKTGVQVISPETGKEDNYRGLADARRYLSEFVVSPNQQDPFAILTRIHQPGDWRDDTDDAIEEMTESPAERIISGIRPIDDAVAIRKGEMVGFLGYTGSGKSTVGRTFAYNAMRSGRNVLHVVTEGGGRKVERIRYAIAHAHHLDPARARSLGITFKAYADEILTKAGIAFLREAIEDLSQQEGGITVVCPGERSWRGIQSIIESQARSRTADVLYIDYLTHLVPAAAKDPRAAMSAIIHSAQDLAANYDQGKGLALITPVQGNRKGFEAAQKAGGVWDLDGLFEYSAFGMDCDLLLYVYSDDDLKSLNQIKIGTAKARSSAGMPCTTLEIDKFTRMVKGPNHRPEPVDMNDLIEDLAL